MKHFFWSFGATMAALVRVTGSHPLCRALEGGKPSSELNGLPTRHTCHGGGDSEMVVCSSAVEASDSRTLVTSNTWWICQGQLGLQDISGEDVVDCEGYFAVRGDYGDSGRTCQNPGIHMAMQEENPPSDTQRELSMMAPGGRIELATKPVDLGRSWVCGAADDEMMPIAEQFVHTASNDCDPMWETWPDVHEIAVAKGTVIVFKLFPAVGNLFMYMGFLIKVARVLELAVVLDVQNFQEFRVAFDPARIMWDLDVAQIMERVDDIAAAHAPGGTASDLHAFKFLDASMILADSQLEHLAQLMGIDAASPAEAAVALKARRTLRGILWIAMKALKQEFGHSNPPCAWNMFLRRSSSMVASLAAQCPWGKVDDRSGLSARPPTYVAWHIRTSDGETEDSFNPAIHHYVFHNQPSTTVCPLFFSTTIKAQEMCRCDPDIGDRLLARKLQSVDLCERLHGRIVHFAWTTRNTSGIRLACNVLRRGCPHDAFPTAEDSIAAKSLSRNCSVVAEENMVRAGFVDFGVADSDVHTWYSKHPTLAATNAFSDFLMLVDASIVVMTGSSFSWTAASIKGLTCHVLSTESFLPIDGMRLCLPTGC